MDIEAFVKAWDPDIDVIWLTREEWELANPSLWYLPDRGIRLVSVRIARADGSLSVGDAMLFGIKD
jgi:hypothetical protein